ncbi:hypothetical protein BJ912DRAFT_927022 [Pholiota molesta]|nr:hypothetical protein BJ912DRAFT_927022 [Pholiota molesta]
MSKIVLRSSSGRAHFRKSASSGAGRGIHIYRAPSIHKTLFPKRQTNLVRLPMNGHTMLQWNASIKESSSRTHARRLDSHLQVVTNEYVDGELKFLLVYCPPFSYCPFGLLPFGVIEHDHGNGLRSTNWRGGEQTRDPELGIAYLSLCVPSRASREIHAWGREITYLAELWTQRGGPCPRLLKDGRTYALRRTRDARSERIRIAQPFGFRLRTPTPLAQLHFPPLDERRSREDWRARAAGVRALQDASMNLGRRNKTSCTDDKFPAHSSGRKTCQVGVRLRYWMGPGATAPVSYRVKQEILRIRPSSWMITKGSHSDKYECMMYC